MDVPKIVTVDRRQRNRRPKMDRRVYTYLTEYKYKALVELSDINQRSIADLVRLVLNQYLEQQQWEQQTQPEEQAQQPTSSEEAYRQSVADAETHTLREQQAADRNRLLREIHR